MRKSAKWRKILAWLFVFTAVCSANMLPVSAQEALDAENKEIETNQRSLPDEEKAASGETLQPDAASLGEPAVSGSVPASFDPNEYNADDVAALNLIMDQVGLQGYAKDDPAHWGGFTQWSYETGVKPYRLTVLNLFHTGVSGVLDVSGLPTMESLDVPGNQLTSVIFGSNSNLKEVRLANNRLTSLDVSALTELTLLDCSQNQITELNISANNAKLELFNCNLNQLNTLDISGLSALRDVDCSGNDIASLNISNTGALENIQCAKNNLTSVDLSTSPELKNIGFGENQLTQLDVSHNTKLNVLYCPKNQLTSLNVDHLTELEILSCEENQITSLNLLPLQKIQTVNCMKNQITDFNVKGMTSLKAFQNELNPVKTVTTVPGNVVTITQPIGGTIQFDGYSVQDNAMALRFIPDEGIAFVMWTGLPADAAADKAMTRFRITQDLNISARTTAQIPLTGDGSNLPAYFLLASISLGGISLLLHKLRKKHA